MIVVFDLDGTLADDSHRQPFLGEDKKPTQEDWDRYYAACAQDTPVEPLCEIVRMFYQNGHSVRIWTGRPERYGKETEAWLRRHRIPYDSLRMRPDDDYRPANVLKGEWLDHVEQFNRPVALAFDDRASAVKWWRERGVVCCDVAGNPW